MFVVVSRLGGLLKLLLFLAIGLFTLVSLLSGAIAYSVMGLAGLAFCAYVFGFSSATGR